MASREKSLYQWLLKGCRSHDHLCRVENSACPGMPDVEGHVYGRQVWLELKCADRPARDSTPLRLRFEPGQLPWLKDRWRAGGSAFLLVQLGTGHNASRHLMPATEHATEMLRCFGFCARDLMTMDVLMAGHTAAADVLRAAALYRSA